MTLIAQRPGRQSELQHHEALYSGEAQRLFAQGAVRAFRGHLCDHLVRRLQLKPSSRVLSLGCGIGDTELLLAPRVGHITGVDLSPAAIGQAKEDAERAGLGNVEFVCGEYDQPEGSFDAVYAIFLLHHLPDEELAGFPALVRRWLAPGGRFYSLDPSRRRLSGAIGRLLVPGLMAKYRTKGERELVPEEMLGLFQRAGFAARLSYYDFTSTPLAGLLPGWRLGYQMARRADDVLTRVPGLSRLGSNFELVVHNGLPR